MLDSWVGKLGEVSYMGGVREVGGLVFSNWDDGWIDKAGFCMMRVLRRLY